MVLRPNLTAEQAQQFTSSSTFTRRVYTFPPPGSHEEIEELVSSTYERSRLPWTPPALASTSVEGRDETFLVGNKSLEDANLTGEITANLTVMSGRDENLAKVEIGLLAAILYFALFGNGIVLLILRLRRQKLSRMQWFIAHLAIADIFVAFFNVLPQLVWDILGRFYGNDFLCKSVTYLQVVAMYASPWVLVMAAVDRYVSICHPLTSQTLTPKRVHLMISVAWSLSLVFALPQFFIFSYGPSGGGYNDCMASFMGELWMTAYVTWVFVVAYAVPFIILAFCYGRICHVVWISVSAKESSVLYRSVHRSDNHTDNKPFRLRISFRSNGSQSNSALLSPRDRLCTEGGVIKGSLCSRASTANNGVGSGYSASHNLTSPSPANSSPSSTLTKNPRAYQRGGGVSRSKIKTVKLTLTVVLCFLLCWAPFFFVQLYSVYGNSQDINHPAVVLLMLLASLNSCTNPWIYLAFSGCKTCPGRHVSRSWGPSTHQTSGGGDSHGERDTLTSSHRANRGNRGSPSVSMTSSTAYHNRVTCHHSNREASTRRNIYRH